MQTPFVPSQVKRCPHFGDFQVWQLMHTRAIECSLLLFTVKKAICPVASTMCISGSAWRIVCKRHAIIKWILYSQGTRGTKKMSTLWNSEVSAFGCILKYCITNTSIGTTSSGYVSCDAIGKCPLREIPLYFHPKPIYQTTLFMNLVSILRAAFVVYMHTQSSIQVNLTSEHLTRA